VTGASSGIGAALAVRLARDGTLVVLAARRADALAEIAREIEAAGGKARIELMDVADGGATADAVRRLDDALGGLELVVANAGVGGMRWSGTMSFEGCAPMIDVNVTGTVATLTAILDRMVARGHGHVVGVSSMAAVRGLPHNALYSATKAFTSTFLESLRVDLAGTGVAVTEVRPGYVRTPMTDALDAPKPFMIEPEEAAEVIARGIARRDALVAFPWAMATLTRSIRWLPVALYDRAARIARPPR
jgi:short-subunit dehydrogenase